MVARPRREPVFEAEDEIDLVFGFASPNPSRRGCPPGRVIRALARRAFPSDHPGYLHLTECSPCYRLVRTVQRRHGWRPAR